MQRKLALSRAFLNANRGRRHARDHLANRDYQLLDTVIEAPFAFAGFGLVLGLDFRQVGHGVIQSDLSLFEPRDAR
jgi:hypothetical protein